MKLFQCHLTKALLAVILNSPLLVLSQQLSTDSAHLHQDRQTRFQAGAVTLKLGGFVKLDIIQDFNPIGETDQFNITTIPTDGSSGTNFRIHARQSRVNLDMRTPVARRDMRIFTEIDFMGSNNSYTPRLRHVYGSWGLVLAGQTWSTFVDEQVIPNTIDIESPNSFPNLRVPQLRLTTYAGKDKQLALSFAIEEATHIIIATSTIPGEENKVTPNFIGRLIYSKPKGHIQVGGMFGTLQYDPDSSSTNENGILWGISLSGKVKIADENAFKGSFTFGDGVNMYRSGLTTATFNTDGEIDVFSEMGIMAAYEHYWTGHLSSTISYGYSPRFYEDQQITPESLTKNGHYFSTNLLWWFIGKHGYTGIEYLYGSRETHGNAKGHANRLQVAFKFILP